MAMLITPAAAAYMLARRFVGVMVIGALIGAISAVAGLYVSFHADLPSGPAMALVATAIFGATAVVRKWWPALQRHRRRGRRDGDPRRPRLDHNFRL